MADPATRSPRPDTCPFLRTLDPAGGVAPTDLWTSEIQTGPSRAEYDIPGLAAGPYLLMCPVHPNMQVQVDVT